ncbi:MAG TPA: polyketide cyclase / dehydrase and lipid transport [Mycobacteriales bacterium]|nr:polyketide cyclase / dehydrase and lipid transport [Mycobacteriales bacterium]
MDETFLVAEPAAVAAVLHEPSRWREWWPDLRLSVFQDRADQGIRWTVAGALVGSMEVWLEPFGDGVLLHHYLRADPAGRRVSPRRAGQELRRRQRHAKRVFWRVKDELEGDRRPGAARG